MLNFYYKFLLSISVLLLVIQFSILNGNAQCNINNCSDAPIISSDDPFFDMETNSIQIPNLMYGNFSCSEEDYKSGAVLYIYQLMPNGDRISNCTVTNVAPNNFVVRVKIEFGQVDICDEPVFNFGTLPALPENGFDACDGAVYEVEIVLYITEQELDLDFTIYDQIPTSQYIVENLGTVAVNYTDEFPTNADPLTTASIKTFPDGETGTVQYDCGEVLRLDVAALSRLANCEEFDDIETGVPSELYNEFYYSIDGKEPVILQDRSTGAAGGQLTGPMAEGNTCYAGLLGLRTIEFDELEGIVDGSNVVFTITTTDVFTEETVQDQITIIYSGENCPSPQIEGCTNEEACNYNPDATIEDDSCLFNDCLEVCGGSATSGTDCDDGDTTTVNDVYDENCNCVGNQVPGCTNSEACNYNPEATIEDDSCLFNDCLEACGGSATPGTDCDDGDATTVNDVYDENCNCVGNQIPGCTNSEACNYNPEATIEDDSCLFNDCLEVCGGSATPGSDCDDGDATTVNDVYDENCDCVGNQVPGCTNAEACNYKPDATIEDDSCLFNDCLEVCGGSATPGTDCDDGDATTVNDVYDENCNCVGNQVPGCTNSEACNYNPDATIDDDSCLFNDCLDACGGSTTPGTDCDDGDATTVNDVYNENCDCAGNQVPGCTNEAACNYNPEATIDDESCRFESYYFNCNCEEPCPAGFDQDDQCNCNSQCGPAPSAGEDAVISACENDVPFNLFDALNGTPDVGGQWYFQSKADPLGTTTDFTFTPGSSEDGEYLYVHFQGDECPFSSATVVVTTNEVFETNNDAEICEGESYTLPDGTAVTEAGTYQSILNTIEDCDSIISTLLEVIDLDCLGVCGGSAIPGSSCDDGDPTTTNDAYDENCNCTGNQMPGCTNEAACNYDPEATTDDDSCLFNDCLEVCGGPAVPGATCDDGDATTVNDVYDENCVCIGLQLSGCTNEAACNYNPEATIDDESCRFESYYFNCNCTEPCPAGFDQDDNCNCNSQCGPAPNAGENTEISVCENDASFNLLNALNGFPDEGGAWYFEGYANPILAITNYIFIPGTSQDGTYLYVHWQGDECANSRATLDIITNEIFETTEDVSICESESYTLPDGDIVDQAGTYQSVYNTVENCDSIISTVLEVLPLDCEGECGGPATEGFACDDGDPNTENDVYQEDCTCAGAIQVTCNSRAGTLTLARGGNFENGNYVCFGGEIQIQSSEFVLGADQNPYYIFHSNNFNPDESFPVESIVQYGDVFKNELGQVTIYATAVVANDNGSGQPNFDDQCIVYSNTVELNLLNEISVVVSDYCSPGTLEYSFTFIINGGLPASLSDESYIVAGNFFNGSVKAGESNTVGPINSPGMYDLVVTDSNGCANVIVNDYDCTKLPINLVSFLGEIQEDGDLINWISASEINNDYYTLQYSADGENFINIAQVPGAGTTSDTSEYEFFNSQVVEGYNYYKLLQTDYDNTTTVVGIIELNRIIQSIENDVVTSGSLSVYPLPAENILYVEVEDFNNNPLNIYNASGQKISEQKYTFTASNKLVTINTDRLSSGLYIVNIIIDDKVMAAKFIKQ